LTAIISLLSIIPVWLTFKVRGDVEAEQLELKSEGSD
jgi:hypothetical protein